MTLHVIERPGCGIDLIVIFAAGEQGQLANIVVSHGTHELRSW